MEKAIDIGKLNKRITFQKKRNTKDELGQDEQGWEIYKTVWADFYPIRGGEYQEADKKKREEVTYACKTRFVKGIDASLRIVFKNRTFEIGKVINVDEADYKLEIECTEYIEKEVQNG